jgi:hypothetical protein
MTDKRDANVGQLGLVGGARVENPANMASAHRRSLLPLGGRGKGHLHVLVELSGGDFGREQMAEDLVAAIIQEYFATPGTVTYGLRQALLVADANLHRANERLTSEHRLGGAACVVVRGREAFIAQAGWPTVYLVHGDQTVAFPDTLLREDDISILGKKQAAEIGLFRSPIHPGDMILMLDGAMARHLDVAHMDQIAAGSIERTIYNLQTLAPAGDCSAMVVQIDPAVPHTREPVDQWTFTPVERVPEAESQPIRQEPVPAPSIQEDLRESAPPAQTMDNFGEEFVPASSAQVGDRDLESDNWTSVRPGVEDSPARQTRVPPRSPAGTGPVRGDQIEAILGAIGDGIRTLGERLLPDRQPRTTLASASRTQRRRQAERRRRSRGQAQQPRWGLAVALAIPLLVLVVVGGYTLYRNWSTQSQYNTFIETAQLKRDIALSSNDSPTVARDYWLEVLSSLQAADAIQPDQPEVAQMRDQAEAELDRIDGVTRLGPHFKIFEYNLTGSAPSRIVIAGLDVYVLDRGAGRVYHHALNEPGNALRNPNAEQVLLQQGQQIDGATVGSLVDIAWMQNGGERQAGALAILDRDGLFIEHDPTWTQIEHQTIGGTDQWRAPSSFRIYDANLYVLDPLANQVFKYESESFGESPGRWLAVEGTDLSTAIDMGIDGNIYLLHNTGQLSKYYGGEPTPFTVTRVPRPLSSANALQADVEEELQYIYIADASDRRIVQIDREGTFVRQLQPALGQEDSFRQLSGLFVDEKSGKLYFVAASALYMTDLPPVQQ